MGDTAAQTRSEGGRIIDNLNADEGVTLVDETYRRNDQDLFDTGVLDDEEVVAEKEVSTTDPVTTASEVVTTVGVKVSDAAITPIISMNDITLAKELAALKSVKPMVKELSVHVSAASTSPKVSDISTTSTTVTTTTPKTKGIVMQEPKETTKRTTTIVPSQKVARNLEAQLQAKLKEEERLERQKEEEANISSIAKSDNVQAMMDADHELSEKLQAEEKGELTIKE
nr:hypothetical protein [Tanacetum cinerariifolium]